MKVMDEIPKFGRTLENRPPRALPRSGTKFWEKPSLHTQNSNQTRKDKSGTDASARTTWTQCKISRGPRERVWWHFWLACTSPFHGDLLSSSCLLLAPATRPEICAKMGLIMSPITLLSPKHHHVSIYSSKVSPKLWSSSSFSSKLSTINHGSIQSSKSTTCPHDPKRSRMTPAPSSLQIIWN